MLVVGVNSDETVRRLKGPDRPVSPAEDRAAVVAAIGCVEYVTIFEDDTPIHLLEAVRPDIYVKGGDYDADTLPERLAVECYGGRVVTVGYLPGRSTAGIIERIRAGAEGPWVPAASGESPIEEISVAAIAAAVRLTGTRLPDRISPGPALHLDTCTFESFLTVTAAALVPSGSLAFTDPPCG